MHTMQINGDKTWAVGIMVTSDGQTTFAIMFDKMSFVGALRLVNCLNGGERVADAPSLKSWEACAHG